eukprot:3154530-Rhodomonas_salina.1
MEALPHVTGGVENQAHSPRVDGAAVRRGWRDALRDVNGACEGPNDSRGGAKVASPPSDFCSNQSPVG